MDITLIIFSITHIYYLLFIIEITESPDNNKVAGKIL